MYQRFSLHINMAISQKIYGSGFWIYLPIQPKYYLTSVPKRYTALGILFFGTDVILLGRFLIKPKFRLLDVSLNLGNIIIKDQ